MQRKGAQTAGRALEVMRALVGAEQPLGLADIARATGLNKSAAYRVLGELEAQSFVEREKGGRRYVAGTAMIALAAMTLRNDDLRTAALPVMAAVSDETLETVTLHIRHLDSRICVHVVDGRHPVRRVVPLGETLPLCSGSSGKVILAFLDPDEAGPIIEQARGEGVDVRRLNNELNGIRATGYMAAVGDRNPGVGGFSAPIFTRAGISASLSVSGPGDRWDMQAMTSAAPFILEECSRLSAALGYAGAAADVGIPA